MKQGDWRPVRESFWSLNEAAVVCRELDCGSAVSVGEKKESSDRPVWSIRSYCVQSGSVLRECVGSSSSSSTLDLICSGKPISDIISDIMYDSNVSSVSSPLSQCLSGFHWTEL